MHWQETPLAHVFALPTVIQRIFCVLTKRQSIVQNTFCRRWTCCDVGRSLPLWPVKPFAQFAASLCSDVQRLHVFRCVATALADATRSLRARRRRTGNVAQTRALCLFPRLNQSAQSGRADVAHILVAMRYAISVSAVLLSARPASSLLT